MKIFALDRSTVIEDFTDLSILNGMVDKKRFYFKCSRHEYYIVQLLLLPDYTTDKLEIVPGPLVSKTTSVKGMITCFNTEGVSNLGEKFTRTIPLVEGVLQPIFIGCDFSRSEIGEHKVTIKIGKEYIQLTFTLNDDLIFDDGVHSKTSLARLKWLNSTLAKNIRITEDLAALEISEKSIDFVGKTVNFGRDGLIDNVESYFSKSIGLQKEVQSKLFYQPMALNIDGARLVYSRFKLLGKGNTALLTTEGRNPSLKVEVSADVFYEGAMDYTIKVTALDDFVTQNISLDLFYDNPEFIVGLGGRAREITKSKKFKWDEKKNQNEVFIGKVNASARVQFIGTNQSKTVVGYFDKFPSELPDTWYNDGRGSLEILKTEQGAVLRANTGRVILPVGDSYELKFSIHLMPFKPINLKKSLSLRIGRDQTETTYDKMIERANKDGLTYLNITYGGEANPYLNYPFPYVKAIATLSRKLHDKGLGLSLSYNLREISTQNREIYAYKALGDELLLRSKVKDETHANRVKDIGDDVIVDKVVRYNAGKRKGQSDQTVICTPSSRMDNYYVEGINYFIKNADIDAITMRDATVGRETMERIKKIMGQIRGIPGIIEMQISDQFNDKCGFANSLNYYTDVLPFMDKVWLDGSFDKAVTDPKELLIEVSGIPYGIAVAGPENASIIKCLLYAMLPKYGLTQDISFGLSKVYKILDEFEIGKAEFYGYWDDQNPFVTDNSNVLCSCYKNGEDMLVIMYNFSSKKERFDMGIETKLGYTSVGKRVHSPSIFGEQKAKRIKIGKPKTLKANSGLIFLIKEKGKGVKVKKISHKFFIRDAEV
ncbi:MAG TPA: DUF6067 family protein [Clostridia bacterium]|jgi:hypothetical protein|nr:DUF6067 family protein [Clostridia bacterium]